MNTNYAKISGKKEIVEKIMEDVLLRYIRTYQTKSKRLGDYKMPQVNQEGFLNRVRELCSEVYPEINEYHKSKEMFSDWWIEDRIENKMFCFMYGIVTKKTTEQEIQ